MIQTDARRRRCRPAKAISFDNFRIETDPAAIPPHDPDTVLPFGTEHVKGAVERIETAIPDQSHQRSRSLAKVDRLAGDVNDNARRNHALRTARRILAR